MWVRTVIGLRFIKVKKTKQGFIVARHHSLHLIGNLERPEASLVLNKIETK